MEYHVYNNFGILGYIYTLIISLLLYFIYYTYTCVYEEREAHMFFNFYFIYYSIYIRYINLYEISHKIFRYF